MGFYKSCDSLKLFCCKFHFLYIYIETCLKSHVTCQHGLKHVFVLVSTASSSVFRMTIHHLTNLAPNLFSLDIWKHHKKNVTAIVFDSTKLFKYWSCVFYWLKCILTWERSPFKHLQLVLFHNSLVWQGSLLELFLQSVHDILSTSLGSQCFILVWIFSRLYNLVCVCVCAPFKQHLFAVFFWSKARSYYFVVFCPGLVSLCACLWF